MAAKYHQILNVDVDLFHRRGADAPWRLRSRYVVTQMYKSLDMYSQKMTHEDYADHKREHYRD